MYGAIILQYDARPDDMTALFRGTELNIYASSILGAVEPRFLAKWTDELNALFGYNSYGSDFNTIRQSLAHYRVWKYIAAQTTDRMFLIADDTAQLRQGLVTLWGTKYSSFPTKEVSLMFLTSPISAPGNFTTKTQHPSFRTFTKGFQQRVLKEFVLDGSERPSRSWPFFHIDSYFLSTKGAKELVKFIQTFGFRRSVSHHLVRLISSDTTAVVYADPPLASYHAPQAETNPIPGGPGTI